MIIFLKLIQLLCALMMLAFWQPHQAAKGDFDKVFVRFIPVKQIIEDSEWTIIPKELPSAWTCYYTPEPDPYPYFVWPNFLNANIGKLGTAEKVMEFYVVRLERWY